MVLVKAGVGELPKINGNLRTGSALSGKQYEVTVKKIVDLRWNSNGDLVVEVSGSKKEI